MPSVAEWNEHVVAFHDTYGDGTPGFVSRFRTADGLTSYELLAARIRLGARHDSRVLDVGCGSGELLRVLAASIPHAVLEGIDLSERQLALARDAVPGARLVQGDAASLAFAERGYDAIAAHLSIMSMPHTEAILHALHRGLKPNGLLVLATEDPLSGDSIVRGIAASLTHLAGRFPGSAFAIPERASIERDDVLRNALAAAGFSNVSLERVTLRAGRTNVPVGPLGL